MPQMSYPGNRALASNVQERILRTFEQTLDLAARGQPAGGAPGLRLRAAHGPAVRAGAPPPGAAGGQQRPGSVNDLGAAPRGRRGARQRPLRRPRRPDFDLPGCRPPSPAWSPTPGAARRAPVPGAAARRRARERHGHGRPSSAASSRPRRSGWRPSPTSRSSSPRPGRRGRRGATRRSTSSSPRPDRSTRVTRRSRRCEAPAPVVPEAAFPSLDLLHPAAGLFDAPAAHGGDSESERRIAELLDEGQRAFESGDHQAAIDAWSRIFLIDIDHQEAARRIEQARQAQGRARAPGRGDLPRRAGEPRGRRCRGGPAALRASCSRSAAGLLRCPRVPAAARGGRAAAAAPRRGARHRRARRASAVAAGPGRRRDPERRDPGAARARAGTLADGANRRAAGPGGDAQEPRRPDVRARRRPRPAARRRRGLVPDRQLGPALPELDEHRRPRRRGAVRGAVDPRSDHARPEAPRRGQDGARRISSAGCGRTTRATRTRRR